MPRPSFRPTKEQKKLVKALAAIALPHDKIALTIGIRSPKTLRKHFRRELANGYAEAVAAVTRTAYEMAVSGKYPDMTEYWLYIMEGPAESAFAGDDEHDILQRSTCDMVFVGAHGLSSTRRSGMPRRKFQPTEELRARLKAWAGFGMTKKQICNLIGLRSTKTLHKYFRGELELGPVEAHISVSEPPFGLRFPAAIRG
jgi:hypothetical protein